MPPPPPPLPPRSHPYPWVKRKAGQPATKANPQTKNGRPPGWQAQKARVGQTFTNRNGDTVNSQGQIPARADGKKKPTNFTDRHRVILWMDIAGQRVVDIAAAVKMHPQSVSAIRTSEVYHVQKQLLLEQLQTQTFGDVLEMIRRDVPRNLQVLIDLRDNNLDDKLRLAAARQLSREADRVYPRKTEHVEERTIRVELDGTHLNRLAAALREVGATIPAELVDPDEPPPDRPLIEGKSVDELVDQFRAEEARRADESD